MTLHDAILAAAPILAVVALVFGPLAAWMAARRQRNPAVWLLFGAFLGPVAVVLIQTAPPARCPNCSEPTVGFESRCSICGIDLRRPDWTTSAGVGVGVMDGRTQTPLLRSVPGSSSNRGGDVLGLGGHPEDVAIDARPDRLSAIGARRPGTATAGGAGGMVGARLDMTLLAMGVLVRATERLLPGSRYLIARTFDRLLIIGPIEASNEHIELDLPLAGIEANFVADRLVISGTSDDRSRRPFLLGFQAVASMTGAAVDEAIMERVAPISIAATRP